MTLSKAVCAFCGLDDSSEDSQDYGEFIRNKNLSLHYFCMLFSCGLNQRGKSTRQGILGFLEKDIKKEVYRGNRLRCIYCKTNGATIGCSVGKCRAKFHLPCGLKKESLHQYFGSYVSFCSEHRPKQEVQLSDHLSLQATVNVACPICLGSIEPCVSNHTLRAPCCRNTWIHRKCVQAQALNAGYFFKCPLCNNKLEFQVEMLTHGIYVPEQDASWEREENAFHDLLFRHNRCDHLKCEAPKGPEYNKDGSRWQVILCNVCGSQGCHIACGKLKFSRPAFVCDLCKSIVTAIEVRKKKKRKLSPSPKSGISGLEQRVRSLEDEPSSSAGIMVASTSLAPMTEIIEDPTTTPTGAETTASSSDDKITRDMLIRRIRRACFVTWTSQIGVDNNSKNSFINNKETTKNELVNENFEDTGETGNEKLQKYGGDCDDFRMQLLDESEDVDVETVFDPANDGSQEDTSDVEIDVCDIKHDNDVGLLQPQEPRTPSPHTNVNKENISGDFTGDGMAAPSSNNGSPQILLHVHRHHVEPGPSASYTPPRPSPTRRRLRLMC